MIDVAALVISTARYTSLVTDELARAPELAAALRAAGAHLVVFDVESSAPGGILDAVQRGLDAAEASLPARVTRPIYIAFASASELFKTGLFRGRARGPVPVAPRRRGVLGGFIGRGEGGMVFMGSDGTLHGRRPSDEAVRGWIAAVSAG